MSWFKQHKTLSFITLTVVFVIVVLMLMTQEGAIWDWLNAKWDWLNKGTHSDTVRNLPLIAFGIVGFILAFWRTNIADEQAKIAQKNAETAAQQAKIADTNSVTHIFNQAIEQLGTTHDTGQPKREIRVGAIYALEKLSQTNEEYTQVIINILTTYLRENAPNEETAQEPITTDRQTAITVIGRSQQTGKTLAIDLSNTVLTEADLSEANLTKAILQWTRLTGAYLLSANLTDVNLRMAYLTVAYLVGANLTKANLTRADLMHADLTRANLTKANLTKADLTNANLTEADLKGANLDGAIVSTAQLAHAKNLDLAKNVDNIITPEAADSSDTTTPPAK